MANYVHVIKLCMHEPFYIAHYLIPLLADRIHKIHGLTLLCSEGPDTALVVFDHKVRIIMNIGLEI